MNSIGRKNQIGVNGKDLKTPFKVMFSGAKLDDHTGFKPKKAGRTAFFLYRDTDHTDSGDTSTQ